MRKTVSLDTDVALAIEQEAADDDRTFSNVMNRKLRLACGLPAQPTRRTSAGTESASRRSTPRRRKAQPA